MAKSVLDRLGPANLFKAVEAGDLKRLRVLVAAGASLDGRRGDGVTPLTLASSLGDSAAVQALVDLGADPSVPTSEGWTALDFAKGKGNIAIENILYAASRARTGPHPPRLTEVAEAQNAVQRDLAHFLDQADLVLPKKGFEWLRARLRKNLGSQRAAEVEAELARTNYRVLFEQIFGSEALATAHFSGNNFLAMRSPMALGAYDVDLARRRGVDLVELFKEKFEITDKLLRELLPDDLFTHPPNSVCEIGGAWGATIKHLVERFEIKTYHNYEPDRHYAQWAAERFGVSNMPVDGETLSGTESDSMDLVLANNVLIFVPPIKIWSYLIEMRRVIRRGGLILFNAVVSDQLTELDLQNQLMGQFPRRTFQIVPRDVIDRTFPAPDFELLKVFDKEYFLFRKLK